MITKAVLYAICKNEENTILSWIDYHKYFDAIYLLDTGSTDSTIEKVKTQNIRIDCIPYDRMNFGDAKNIAFKRAQNIFPEEKCLYINLDIDEWLDELTFERMRKHWNPDYDGIEVTRTTKQPERKDIQDRIIRIHTGNFNWKWKHVLHENLEFEGDVNLLRSEYSFLHTPDMTRPRNYGKLAEDWIRYFLQADPNNSEIDRLLNTGLRSIYFNDKENMDENFILKTAEKRLLIE